MFVRQPILNLIAWVDWRTLSIFFKKKLEVIELKWYMLQPRIEHERITNVKKKKETIKPIPVCLHSMCLLTIYQKL